MLPCSWPGISFSDRLNYMLKYTEQVYRRVATQRFPMFLCIAICEQIKKKVVLHGINSNQIADKVKDPLKYGVRNKNSIECYF